MCALIILFIVNVVVLPVVYILRGRAVGAVSVFFVLAVLLCVVMLGEPMSYIASFASVLIFSAVHVYVYRRNELPYYGEGNTAATLAELCYAVFFCGVMCGVCIKLSIYFYSIEKVKAEEARSEVLSLDESKNVFLSNMSHEMRTPMNAILGTSQLLMDSDIDENSKGEVTNVINACHALLFTVEDLLDFSYQANGSPAIHEREYELTTLVDDVVNMMSISLMDKGVELFVDMDPNVPVNLYGDAKRLRQVIIYLLSNSMQYTTEGSIVLRVGCRESSDTSAVLEISITDTGVGMDATEVSRMFDTEYALKNKNSSEEVRTILGLAFCKDVMEGMDGELCYEGGDEEGTKFVISLRQGVSAPNEPLDTKERGKLRALVFEKDKLSSDMLEKALVQCGVATDVCESADAFREKFNSVGYTHIFLDHNNYTGLDGFLRENLGDRRLIVVTGVTRSSISGCPGNILIRPVDSINIDALLENRDHSSLRRMTVSGSFTCPGIRAMAVDDNLTNLKVISALLSKYGMEVYMASGGQECLNRLESQEVDIIFLDYMMPEMDGIDTLKRIRKMDRDWVERVPIIALTANAVEGVREMLLSEGFDEYPTKPVEMKKLDRCIISQLPISAIKFEKEETVTVDE